MAIRRAGDRNAFWDNAAVVAAGTSTAVEIPRGAANLAIYATVSAATIITVQVGHQGDLTSEGLAPDATPATWFDLYYTDARMEMNFTAAGSRALIIPDIVPGWIRLHSSAAATITAGWEAGGD